MDLGQKMPSPEAMYPTSVEKGSSEKTYTTIRVPLKILGDKKIKKGDKIEVCISGEVTGIHDDEYSAELTMKAEEGELTEGGDEAAEGEEPGTFLGKG